MFYNKNLKGEYGVKKSVLKAAVKFTAFKIIYPLTYNLCCLIRKRQRELTLFCEVRHDHITDTYLPIIRALEKKGMPYKVIYIHNNRGGLGYLWRYLKLCVLLPTAGTVLVDDTCNLFGAFKLRKGTKLIQTWHSCGAFKKWGYAIAGLSFGDDPEELDKYPAHTNYTLVTVSGKECVRHFDDAFGFARFGIKSPVRATGVARTDYFFDENNRAAAFEHIYEICPAAKGKRIVLYAPTYRGDADKAQPPKQFDIARLMGGLRDCVLLIKQHGFVEKQTEIPKECADIAFDVSRSAKIEELLFVSDVCITDYSSLVFEYSLFEKPMVFYAYDLDEFYDYRGFFYRYDDEFLPGDIIKDEDKLSDSVSRALDGEYDRERIRRFRDKFMGACDGHSTERIVRYIIGNSSKKKITNKGKKD